MSNKDILLGVTGSIAAYKACEIASRLVEFGAVVTVALTESASRLVGPATFRGLTGRDVITGMFDPLQGVDSDHIRVAERADLFLIAPATANIFAKAAHGVADDWLSTTLLATRAPILFAPAMNANMYSHPATQANIETLKARRCAFVGPEAGRLACGTEGVGRMADPLNVIEAAIPLLSRRRDLSGRRVLITSGGTHEPLDPVRFIGNRSSGAMGRALALEALARGADVAVVAGPATVALPYGVERTGVRTAEEMAEAVSLLAPDCDVVIGAAAVGDFKAKDRPDQKRRRGAGPVRIDLVENPDIIKTVGDNRRPGQVVVGFSVETALGDAVTSAETKLEQKNLDLIVANEVGAPDSDFGTATTRAAIIHRDGPVEELPVLGKDELAERLFERIVVRLS